jgi:hypothetical protein
LGVAHWLETNNELTRKEQAINQTYPEGTLEYILDIKTAE